MPRKRSAGEGGIWQEPSGRWRGAISIPTASGISKRVERYGKTRKEVVDKLDELKRNLAQGVNLLTKSPTVAQFLETWMTKVIVHRKPTTIYRYAQVIRLEIVP